MCHTSRGRTRTLSFQKQLLPTLLPTAAQQRQAPEPRAGDCLRPRNVGLKYLHGAALSLRCDRSGPPSRAQGGEDQQHASNGPERTGRGAVARGNRRSDVAVDQRASFWRDFARDRSVPPAVRSAGALERCSVRPHEAPEQAPRGRVLRAHHRLQGGQGIRRGRDPDGYLGRNPCARRACGRRERFAARPRVAHRLRLSRPAVRRRPVRPGLYRFRPASYVELAERRAADDACARTRRAAVHAERTGPSCFRALHIPHEPARTR